MAQALLGACPALLAPGRSARFPGARDGAAAQRTGGEGSPGVSFTSSTHPSHAPSPFITQPPCRCRGCARAPCACARLRRGCPARRHARRRRACRACRRGLRRTPSRRSPHLRDPLAPTSSSCAAGRSSLQHSMRGRATHFTPGWQWRSPFLACFCECTDAHAPGDKGGLTVAGYRELLTCSSPPIMCHCPPFPPAAETGTQAAAA